jgi:phage baseplate assembly protein W
MPNYGVGLKNLLFESGINASDISEAIETQIKRYIPSINVVDVLSSTDEHKLHVKIVYNFRLNSGDVDAIELVIRD